SGDSGADTVRFTLYDDAGRLLRRIDGRDIVTEYDYDEPGGALTAIRYPAYPAQDVAFTYDALGRRIGMTDATGEHVYSYDDGGRLLAHEVTYTGLDPQTIAYEYYPNGSRSKLTTPAGEHEYTYDAGGRLTALEYGLGTAEWTYLDSGALATQTLPNGAVTSYDYNVANQLVGLLNQAPDSSTISSYGTMTYRGTGDLATITSTIPGASSLAGVVDYAYDTKRQLTLEDSTRDGGYDFGNVFDQAGNATTFRDATQTFNANNQLTGPGTYVYDGNGNPTTFGGTALTWDVENRMTAHGTALEAAYRGDGLRAWKEGATRTYFLYDGINVVCELDAVGDLLASSTFGAAGLLSRGDVQYQFDPLGDAVHLLDATGDVTATRLFDSWGNELTSGDFDPRGYRAKYGYYTDEETGLVALAYRYYGPGVGRFLSRDPIGYRGGVNVYGYVSNAPTVMADAAGLQAYTSGAPDEPAMRRWPDADEPAMRRWPDPPRTTAEACVARCYQNRAFGDLAARGGEAACVSIAAMGCLFVPFPANILCMLAAIAVCVAAAEAWLYANQVEYLNCVASCSDTTACATAR
ncbi:MAG: hypothetical protein IT204_18120, partial [Fimbriimonadaceae bacterium]|nr:hypothetical protein [Fimbriimonadaceae bacterium]